MTRNTGTAYKSTDPAVVSTWKITADQRRQARNRAVEEAEQIGKNNGLMIQRSLDPEQFVGLSPIDPADPPEGWRHVRNQFEPRRGKAGDDARDWLKSVQLPSMRDAMAAHRLPQLVFGGGHMGVPAMLLHDDAVWVLYTVAPDPDEVGPAWEPCRVSEFYAAQEASEAVNAA